jgi:hypothetical protein
VRALRLQSALPKQALRPWTHVRAGTRQAGAGNRRRDLVNTRTIAIVALVIAVVVLIILLA